MTEPALFDMDRPPLDEMPKLSADQRRTRRQYDDVRRGVHPLARVCPLIVMHPDADRGAQPNDGVTVLRCGSCRWREPRGYPKCMHQRGTDRWPTNTCGPATDCRAWWPACTQYEAVAP